MSQNTDSREAPVPDWSESQYLHDNYFDRLAARRIYLKKRSDAIARELVDLNLELGAMLATANLHSVTYDNYRLTLSHAMKGGRLSRERLLELGVTAEQLEKATSPRVPGDAFVTVTTIKAEKEEQDTDAAEEGVA